MQYIAIKKTHWTYLGFLTIYNICHWSNHVLKDPVDGNVKKNKAIISHSTEFIDKYLSGLPNLSLWYTNSKRDWWNLIYCDDFMVWIYCRECNRLGQNIYFKLLLRIIGQYLCNILQFRIRVEENSIQQQQMLLCIFLFVC